MVNTFDWLFVVCLLTFVFCVCPEFDGLAANVVKAADHSAVKLVKLVLAHFPGKVVIYVHRCI